MITTYPDKNSLKEVLSSELSMSALKDMCKERGIFLLSNDKKDIINTAHMFYWGFADINRISSLMEDSKNYKKSFQLELPCQQISNTEDEENNFLKFYNNITSYRNNIASLKGISFEALSIDGTTDNKKLKATVIYKKKKPGRVKLMDEVTQRFSFETTELQDGKIVIDVVFDDRSDVNIAKTLISDVISSSEDFKVPKQVSLQGLTTAERVDLFDRFFTYAFLNWRVDVVRNIKVQKVDVPDANEGDIEEEIEEEVENNFLAGIESALFTGFGLRTNPIVVDAVNKGYFFPKAIIMLEHRREALKMLLDVSFNTDELLLEVSIVATYDVEEGRISKRPISIDEQTSALQYFQNVINSIYQDIKNERIARTEQSLQGLNGDLEN